ncbi:MAG: hypothetical protein ABSE76_01195 [Minisyncoccia bacterium]
MPDRKPRNPDIIVPLGYGCNHDALARATTEAMQVAIEQLAFYPRACVAFGNSSHCYSGSELFEAKKKLLMLERAGIRSARIINAGAITNTVMEARAIKAEILRHPELKLSEVLLIAEHFHAYFGADAVWKKTFPGVVISLKKIATPAYQKDHVFPAQQTFRGWLMAGVKRRAALKIMGIDWVGKFKHKS